MAGSLMSCHVAALVPNAMSAVSLMGSRTYALVGRE